MNQVPPGGPPGCSYEEPSLCVSARVSDGSPAPCLPNEHEGLGSKGPSWKPLQPGCRVMGGSWWGPGAGEGAPWPSMQGHVPLGEPQWPLGGPGPSRPVRPRAQPGCREPRSATSAAAHRSAESKASSQANISCAARVFVILPSSVYEGCVSHTDLHKHCRAGGGSPPHGQLSTNSILRLLLLLSKHSRCC